MYQATGEAVLTRPDDTMRFNGALSRTEQGYYERVGVLNAAGAPITTDVSASTFVNEKLEFGGDYERTLGGLGLRVLALQTLQWERRDGTQDIRSVRALVGERGELGESIARVVLTAQPRPSLSLEGGGEAAFNFLDAATSRIVSGLPLALPNANVRVEERRAEGFLKASWRASPRFSAEAELRTEVSRISQTGDSNTSKSFFFPKPRLQATWSPRPANQLRLRVEREVGQLNFRDFAASSAVDAGTVNVGNADLEPERAWVVEGAIEHRFWGRGAVVLTYQHAWLEEVVDLIPVNNAFDAPGNIGSGKRSSVNMTLAVPLDQLRIRRGLLRGGATFRWSEVTDPVTGETRRISGTQRPSEANLTFTQDLPRLRSSWGVDYISRFDDTFYRINEVRRNVKGVWFIVFWEWRPRPDLSIRADITNPTARLRARYREQYLGTRATGVLAYTERRAWKLDPLGTIRIRKVL